MVICRDFNYMKVQLKIGNSLALSIMEFLPRRGVWLLIGWQMAKPITTI